jgi:drug/metabolite transporter (DMT)-like permease
VAPPFPLRMIRPGARAYAWMLAGSLCFATMGALSRSLGATTDWRMLALVRSALMAIFAVALTLVTRAPFTIRGTPTLWMRSVVGSLGMLCTFYTLTHLQFSEATTLLKSYPIAVSALAWIVLRERAGAKVWIAVALGVAGVVLIARPHFEESRLAILVGLVSSLMTAVVMLGLNRLSAVDTRTIVTHFALVATATSGIATAIAGGPAWTIGHRFGDPRGLSMLLGMGLVGTLGQMAMTRAFATGEASRVSVVGLTELLFALGYDGWIWHRSFSVTTLAGMALVAAPTAWILASAPSPAPGGSPPPPGPAAPSGSR